MSCGISCIKYLLFVFNFVFALLGLAILIVGVWIHLELTDYEKVSEFTSSPAIALIVVGVIIFVIAFFGCCGAIRESHCMVVTFAVFLLTILIVQIAIGVWAFIESKDFRDTESKATLTSNYQKVFTNYWTSETDRVIVDSVQSSLSCCGINSSSDFATLGNATIPWSCCGNIENVACTSNIYSNGCVDRLVTVLEQFARIIGGVAIGVAATELVGIIFALCLANSIKNDSRRGYRV